MRRNKLCTAAVMSVRSLDRKAVEYEGLAYTCRGKVSVMSSRGVRVRVCSEYVPGTSKSWRSIHQCLHVIATRMQHAVNQEAYDRQEHEFPHVF